jgi:transglutaminase-like putative cysteine protease
MSKILIGSELSYDIRQPTVLLFKISAAKTSHQYLVSEELHFNPQLQVETLDFGLDGNRAHRVFVQPCKLQISYKATMEMSPEVVHSADVKEATSAQIPADVLPYLNPSRYCESDLLGRFAFEEFGNLPLGFQRVQAICDWVNQFLDYTPGATNATTTAADVLLMRTGVCRDYAHLAISLCRGVGIPARYVSGYAVNLNPPDFHGFIEAYLDGRWFLFDPSKLSQLNGLVRIGTGRDAADVAFATINGNAILTQKSVWASHAKDSAPPTPDVQAAISIA